MILIGLTTSMERVVLWADASIGAKQLETLGKMSSVEYMLGGPMEEPLSGGARHCKAERWTERLSLGLNKANQTISDECQSPEDLLAVLVRELVQVPDTAAAILMITADGNHFTVSHVHALMPSVMAMLRDHLLGRDAPFALCSALKCSLLNRVPLFISEGERHDRAELSAELTEVVEAANVTSLLIMPLTVQGTTIGAIVLGRLGHATPPFDERALMLVQSLTEHAGLALTTARLLEAAKRELAEREKMAARLRSMAETSQEFAEATGDYDRLLASIAKRLATVLGDLCSVRAVGEDGQMLEYGAVHHADTEIVKMVAALIAQPQRIGEGVAGRVIMSGQPLFAPRLTPADWVNTLPHYRVILERLRVGSTMIVPLRCRGEAVGVLSLARSGFDNPYTQDDLHLVQNLADRAALAISNARSYRAERAARSALTKANEALRESEIGHRLLFESSPVPVLAFSVDTLDILAANRAALRLYGYTQTEMSSMKISDFREDPDQSLVRTILADAGDGELAGSVRHVRKDGSLFFAEYHSHTLVLKGQHARITVITDVTARHDAEQMRALLSAVVCSSSDAIVSTDLGGNITSWNAAAESLFGYLPEEVVGNSSSLLVPENVREEEAKVVATIASGVPISNYETVRRCRNGGLVNVSLSLSPILDIAGNVVGTSTTARDLSAQLAAATALRKTEEQLRQAQKMEAVGQLAGGIAHDFNNVLSVILAHCDLIWSGGREARLSPDWQESVVEIQTAALRAADLTRQLLTFSRKQVIAPRVVDLNEVLQGMDKMLRRVIGEDIELLSSPVATVGRVSADRSNLDQVILNLVVNARDAMPTGGKLTIETANVELDSEYAHDHLGVRPGPYVMLAVSDTGHGMDAATRERIFEPFFTTKPKEKGTGLGLSTVFGIVQQAGGSVGVYSELGKGTVFKVYLPRVESEVEASIRAQSQSPRRGTETILLVEDQENVRAVALTILARNGYRVIVAGSALDALELSEQHRGEIDLLLTDVVMPHLSGTELAKRVVQSRPHAKVLYMSGYTDDSVVRHGVLASTMPFLQKPFTSETLTAKVRDVLDAE